VPDYWGADLPVNRGRDNFDVMRYDYYRDATVALEAFKAGQYDFRVENSAKAWATGYDIPPCAPAGSCRRRSPTSARTGMQGFAINTRRPLFQDRARARGAGLRLRLRVVNKNLFYGQYRAPQLLLQLRAGVEGLPGEGGARCSSRSAASCPRRCSPRSTAARRPTARAAARNLRDARSSCSQEAGWRCETASSSTPTGQPFALRDPAVEPALRAHRAALREEPRAPRHRPPRAHRRHRAVPEPDRRQFDFDMIVTVVPAVLSPGNEQRDFWGSEAADSARAAAISLGIKDPAVDALIER
jgi:microcin C transport system substrate-binding protein